MLGKIKLKTENDLISRSALYLELSKEASHCIELGTKAGVSWATALQEAKRILQNAPAVDAVLVVRCKDCQKSRPLKRKDPFENKFVDGCIWCMEHGDGVFEDDYCSYGERRNGDD